MSRTVRKSDGLEYKLKVLIVKMNSGSFPSPPYSITNTSSLPAALTLAQSTADTLASMLHFPSTLAPNSRSFPLLFLLPDISQVTPSFSSSSFETSFKSYMLLRLLLVSPPKFYPSSHSVSLLLFFPLDLSPEYIFFCLVVLFILLFF